MCAEYPAGKPLSNREISRHLNDHGVVAWDNGLIGIAPEVLYEKSYRYEVPA